MGSDQPLCAQLGLVDILEEYHFVSLRASFYQVPTQLNHLSC